MCPPSVRGEGGEGGEGVTGCTSERVSQGYIEVISVDFPKLSKGYHAKALFKRSRMVLVSAS